MLDPRLLCSIFFVARLTLALTTLDLRSANLNALANTAGRQEHTSESTIVNGSVVKRDSPIYSFFALPTSATGSDVWLGCGASIISPTFGLTSAHCFGGGLSPCSEHKSLSLWIGDVTLDPSTFIITPNDAESSIKVDATVTCYPGWDGICAHGHDMVLLKIASSSLPLPSWVKPVPPDLGDWDADGDVTITGFGDMEKNAGSAMVGGPSQHLRKAVVQVLPQDSDGCDDVYTGGYGCSDEASEQGPATHMNMQFCASSPKFKDACAGDSGSPVLAAVEDGDPPFKQIGITSYGGGPIGGSSGPYRECGNPDWPGIYARVSGMKSFLCENVEDLEGYAIGCASAEQS